MGLLADLKKQWHEARAGSYDANCRIDQSAIQKWHEDRTRSTLMGGSSGAWIPGTPSTLNTPTTLGGNSNWSPGQTAGNGGLAAQTYQQATTMANQYATYATYGNIARGGGTVVSLTPGTTGTITTYPATYPIQYQQYAGGGGSAGLYHHQTNSHPHQQTIALPGGISSGTKYICTYNEHTGWTINIEEPDQQIMSPHSFSLSEIEEAQRAIDEMNLSKAHG